MKRKTKIIGVISTFLAVAVAIGFLTSDFDLIPKSKFESSLRKSIQNNRGGIIAISDMTTFKWDRMDIYTPYSTYKDPSRKVIEVDEGECLLVFSGKGAPVTVLKFKRFYGDFSELHREAGYNPSNARFKVPAKDQSKWLKLEWAQTESPTSPVER